MTQLLARSARLDSFFLIFLLTALPALGACGDDDDECGAQPGLGCPCDAQRVCSSDEFECLSGVCVVRDDRPPADAGPDDDAGSVGSSDGSAGGDGSAGDGSVGSSDGSAGDGSAGDSGVDPDASADSGQDAAPPDPPPCEGDECPQCDSPSDCIASGDPGGCREWACEEETCAAIPLPNSNGNVCDRPQSAGAGVCNEGACAECINANHCLGKGSAGVCKQWACNGGLCAAASAPDGDACLLSSGDGGLCRQGACVECLGNDTACSSDDVPQGVCREATNTCVECNSAPHCANRVCHTKSCAVAGTCTYTPTPGAACGSGWVCDNQQRCAPPCGNGRSDPTVEDCDPTASNSDIFHCTTDCEVRDLYDLCPPACPAGSECQAGMCTPTIPMYQASACPDLDDQYQQGPFYGVYCVLTCASTGDCPDHLPFCEDNPFAGADPREADRFCAPMML